MSDGVKRNVRLGSMAYVDPSGRTRRADFGAEVLVHDSDVARFDSLNVDPGGNPTSEPEPVKAKPEPAKATPRGRKPRGG